jgi:ectoine hydroxylase-related dioxygenase (phytanoyl-CoA dioxygenase family)
MDTTALTRSRRASVWLDAQSGDIDAFRRIVATETDPADWPLAAEIARKIPLYDGAAVRAAASDAEARADFMAEWNAVFDTGPGVIVIKGGIPDTSALDEATAIFETIIAREKAEGAGGGDHFAKPGANDRVWNAAEKHCLAAPENFARYYASDAIAMASAAWLGRGYQLTAQVNRVNPGGAAQTPHRDYHLGFMTPAQQATYPAQAHLLSPRLTLQGGVAHGDMPVETGPTMLLPYSQTFFEGYVAFARPEFQQVFAESHVQLPLDKGDVIFFNPAVMHGAGTNRSETTQRLVNLLQVGSAFGRSLEAVNRLRMATTLYPVLQAALKGGTLSRREAANVVAASAEGYAFPTNLDTDPPVGGLIPLSQAERMEAALDAATPPAAFAAALRAAEANRQP